MEETRETVKEAKLDDNTVVGYYACGEIGTKDYSPDFFAYIGDGVIYKINGVLQNSKRRMSFFNRKF